MARAMLQLLGAKIKILSQMRVWGPNRTSLSEEAAMGHRPRLPFPRRSCYTSETIPPTPAPGLGAQALRLPLRLRNR